MDILLDPEFIGAEPAVIRALFDESKHARGTGAQGGQFVAKGSSGSNDTAGFDAKKGSGAGYGTKGGDARVKSLQTYLNRLGFTDSAGQPLKVDGKLGPKTTAAVKRLQRKLGMKADGLVPPALLARLRRATKNPKVRKAGQPARKAAPAKKVAAPAHRRQGAPKARTGFGSKPAKSSAAQAPSSSARAAAARKNSVTRSASVGYSGGMTDLTRHQPGHHNQGSHGNRVGNVRVSGKTGLGASLSSKAEDKPKPREFTNADVLDILVDKRFGGGTEHHPGNSASRKTEDHIKRLTDAGATQEQAHQIVKDLGMNPERGWETKDPAYGLYHRVENEKKAKAESEFRAKLAAATPGAYARLLGTDGSPALVKSKPVRAVFEAMQGNGWLMTGSTGHGGYTFSSPTGDRTIQVLSINGVTIYDARHNKISGVKALAYVRGT